LSEFRYLTFDCYGTLVDWRAGIEAALAKALGPLPKQGAELAGIYGRLERQEETTYKKYRVVLERTALAVSRALGESMGEAEASEFASSVPLWPPFPDSATSLKRLGRMGFKRYILSNVDRDMLEETISRNAFEVDGFVTAEETRSYKPALGHWVSFTAKTGAERSQVLHVAQSVYHDIVPAQELGVASAWVNRYREPMPLSAQPTFVVDGLEGLIGVLG